MENTIKEHELLAKHEANIEEIFHQLGEVKAEVRDIRKLTSAVEKLATQTATLTEKMDKVDSRLVSIEERPGEEDRYYRRMIIGCLITGVIGAALGALSSLLFT